MFVSYLDNLTLHTTKTRKEDTNKMYTHDWLLTKNQ